MRREIKKILALEPRIEVIGVARNGQEAIDMTHQLNPDVVLLDINMPKMDGLTALQVIMMEVPRPVIILSSLTQEGALTTYEALELGAFDYIGKPGGTVSLQLEQVTTTLIEKIKAASMANLTSMAAARRRRRAARIEAKRHQREQLQATSNHFRAILIGQSTGGPSTIFDILPELPSGFPVPIIVIQHMPAQFTPGFAERIHRGCSIPFKQAAHGDILQPGHGYLAPGDLHLLLAPPVEGSKDYVFRTSQYPTDTLHKPCIDLTMESFLHCFGNDLMAILLTGMGDDGADAMVKIRQAGGRTIAESEETAVVFGMPREAIQRGGAEFVLPSHKIAEKIKSIIYAKERRRA